ncbi:MAG: hypothetical protein ACRYF3_12445 [Janthinobacterium lividum]
MSNSRRDGAPDLSALQPLYSAKTSRAVRWIVGIAVTLNIASAALRLTDNRDGPDIGLSIVSIIIWLAWLYFTLFVQPTTRLGPNGPAVRRAGRWRQYLWTQVREVKVQTRWTDVSLLVLHDGRIARLVGMPVEDAQRLADALDARPTS